jgi:beta-N-acetylhexosaminidase
VPVIPDLNTVRTELPDKEGEAFFADLAVRSVTIVKNNGGILPLKAENAGNVLIAFRTTYFRDIGKKAYNGAKSYWYPNPKETGYGAGISDFLSYAAGADTIIFQLSKPEEIDVLRRLQGLKKKIIVLSMLTPAALPGLTWLDAAVAVYSESPESISAGFSTILGHIHGNGILPFAME